MSWKPILEGQLADDATRVARDIATELATPSCDASPADRTLFWAYATNVIDEPFAHAAYDNAMDDLIAALQQGVAHASLYDGGLAGIGWTCSHVLDGGAEDVLGVIDEALVGVLDIDRWNASNDLAQGLVGLGVYFLERLAENPNADLARNGLDRVVRHLDRNSHRSDCGTTWITTVDVMPEHFRTKYPDGFYDLGLAHGVPGMIAFLSRAARIGNERAGTLADEALHWVSLHRDASGFPAIVPPSFPRGSEPDLAVQRSRSRAAWCYGDPGVAAGLWTASPELARATALTCTTHDDQTHGVRDAGLCHGAAGLAHMLNRFYQATGEASLCEASQNWYARTIEMRATGTGVAGYAAYRGDDCASEPLYGLIEGGAGIALALLAATTPAEPSWDRLLLVDLGGRSESAPLGGES